MQNIAAVYRRLRSATRGEQRGGRLPDSVIRDLLHRFELCTVLECHAVSRAALSSTRDVRDVQGVLARLNHAMLAGDAPAWDRLDVEFHRTLNELSGSTVVAQMVERTHHELQSLGARRTGARDDELQRLWLLQTHHRGILGSIQAGEAERGMQQTRAHLQYMRDQLVASMEPEAAAQHQPRSLQLDAAGAR